MNKALKIIRFLLSFVIGIVLITNIILFAKVKVFHEDIPLVLDYGILIVKSGSMSPTLNINDNILVKKTNALNIGDIVVYLDSENALVTHRLIDIYEDEYIMQGDANNTIEEIDKSRVLAKVAWYGNVATGVLAIFNNKAIMLLLLIIDFMIPVREGECNEKKESKIKEKV